MHNVVFMYNHTSIMIAQFENKFSICDFILFLQVPVHTLAVLIVHTSGSYSKTLQKIIYPGNRRFLPANSPLRKDTSSFPPKEPENRDPPILKTMEYINIANQEYSIKKLLKYFEKQVAKVFIL